jgi:general stress protein 26
MMMADDLKQKMWKALDASPFVMVRLDASHQHAVPMNAQLDKDAHGAFWFFTSKDNRLAPGGAAMAQFASKGHDLFACIAGTLSEEHDRTILDRLWNNSIEAWYEGGKSDPNLLLLRFDLGNAEVWEADIGVRGLFKMLTGAPMKGDELGRHAEVNLANG